MSIARSSFGPIDYKTRFPALDGIRALAIALVFIEHFGGGSHGGRVLRLVNQVRLRGWIGVDLFFVLSGFLITGILYDTRFDSHYFKRFFLRRSVRILPIFYLVALLLLIMNPFLHYQLRAGHLLFLLYLGNMIGNYDFSYYNFVSKAHPNFLFNIGHLWSLCVEEQFYLLWPFIVWKYPDRVKLIRIAASLICLAAVFRAILYFSMGAELAERWGVRTLPFRMDSLLMGGVLALLLRGANASLWQRRCRTIFLFAGGATLLMFLAGIDDYSSAFFPICGFTIVALGSAGLIGMVLHSGSKSFRMFHVRPLRTLGKYSYGFYVYHDIFAWAWIQFLVFLMARLHSMPLAGFIALGSNVVVTFLIAKYSYELFEVRFLRLKKGFEYDSELSSDKHAFLTT